MTTNPTTTCSRALPDWYCMACGHEWAALDEHDEPEHWDPTCLKCGARGLEMIP